VSLKSNGSGKNHEIPFSKKIMKRLIPILAAFSLRLISIIVFSFRSQRENSLKDLFEGSFYIGAASNLADVSGTEV